MYDTFSYVYQHVHLKFNQHEMHANKHAIYRPFHKRLWSGSDRKHRLVHLDLFEAR